jgi:hypothetical protein
MIIFACFALAAVASADTYRVTLFQSSVVNGTELKPGDYKVQLTDSKVVISKGKETVEATVKVENGNEKFNATSVRYSNADGKYKIQEIRLGGTKTKLVFAN